MKNKKRILVVEDERSLLELETIILEIRGFDVTGVTSGEEALKQVLDGRFDLVLLDVMLPDMNGFDVCRKIKSNPSTCNTPVIFVSGRKKGGEDEFSKEAGAEAFITKPFKSAEIISMINSLLAGSNSRLPESIK